MEMIYSVPVGMDMKPSIGCTASLYVPFYLFFNIHCHSLCLIALLFMRLCSNAILWFLFCVLYSKMHFKNTHMQAFMHNRKLYCYGFLLMG